MVLVIFVDIKVVGVVMVIVVKGGVLFVVFVFGLSFLVGGGLLFIFCWEFIWIVFFLIIFVNMKNDIKLIL